MSKNLIPGDGIPTTNINIIPKGKLSTEWAEMWKVSHDKALGILNSNSKYLWTGYHIDGHLEYWKEI